MTVESDTLCKRALFETWMTEHEQFGTPLGSPGEPIDRKAVLGQIATLVERQGAPEYVYVLTERRSNEDIPAYVGKARSPVSRWTQHFAGLAKGNGSYGRWRTRLLHNGQDRVQFDLQLHLVGETQIQFSPIPGFPRTIGAVEYQLVGLAADAYPLRLLNHEGQGR